MGLCGAASRGDQAVLGDWAYNGSGQARARGPYGGKEAIGRRPRRGRLDANRLNSQANSDRNRPAGATGWRGLRHHPLAGLPRISPAHEQEHQPTLAELTRGPKAARLVAREAAETTQAAPPPSLSGLADLADRATSPSRPQHSPDGLRSSQPGGTVPHVPDPALFTPRSLGVVEPASRRSRPLPAYQPHGYGSGPFRSIRRPTEVSTTPFPLRQFPDHYACEWALRNAFQRAV